MRWWLEIINNDPEHVLFWYSGDSIPEGDDIPVLVVQGFKVNVHDARRYMKEHRLTYKSFNGTLDQYKRVLNELTMLESRIGYQRADVTA